MGQSAEVRETSRRKRLCAMQHQKTVNERNSEGSEERAPPVKGSGLVQTIHRESLKNSGTH